MLAPPRRADAPAVFERYAADPDVTKYLGWPRHQTVADTELFVALSLSMWQRWGVGPYLIRARDGRLLGSTGLLIEEPGHAVSGYVLAKDAWGQGIATETLTAMVDLARALGLSRLSAMCHPDHRASWRVLEKCGFTRCAGQHRVELPNLAPGRQSDVLRYELPLDARPPVT